MFLHHEPYHVYQLPLPLAQVPCAHALNLAKARLREDPQGATPLLREFANIPEKDAETAAHQIFRKAGLASPLDVSCHDLGAEGMESWPVLKFSSWLRYLIDTKRAPSQLCGVKTMQEMHQRLLLFWERFEALYPEHEVFVRARSNAIDLSHSIPVWSHTDEGRSQKKWALLVISVHGALGRGTSQFLEEVSKDPALRHHMGLNFVGPSWGTQFLFTTMMRTLHQKHPEALAQLYQVFARDMSECALQGVTGKDGCHLYAVQLGTKGDLPALVKAGNLIRSFSRVPKASSSRALCNGICHWCDAGLEGDNPVPFEDLSARPGWAETCWRTTPWLERPPMLEGQLLHAGKESFFYRLDIWHNFHCGLARIWLASSFVVLFNLAVVAGSSVEQRLASLTADYKAFCKQHRLAPHIHEFSRDNLNYDTEKAWPVGKWNKGAASTHMMLFLQSLLEERVVGRTNDVLLLAIVPRSTNIT